MSTRCQVVVKDQYNEIWFYRHSDGYPSGVADTLLKFLELVKSGKIRDNAEQSAGWLVILGAVEYQRCDPEWFSEAGRLKAAGEPSYMRVGAEVSKALASVTTEGAQKDFKVGAYEPCSTGCVHSDIEHFYLVDLTVPEAYAVALEGLSPNFERRTVLSTLIK